MTDKKMAVLVSANKRPYYLEPVLTAWSKVRGIGDVSRFIIPLAPSAKFMDQARVIERARPRFGCPVDVRTDSYAAATGPAMHRALGEAITNAFTDDPDLGFLVCGEEDQIPSDDVLEYMTWARDRFTDDPQVLIACAHNQGGQGWDEQAVPSQDADADQNAVRLLPYFNPWIWGLWRDRWEYTVLPQWDWDANLGDRPDHHGYDWGIQLRTIPSGPYLVTVPDASRSQNIGKVEGVYAHPELFHLTQSQSFREHREPCDYRLIASEGA